MKVREVRRMLDGFLVFVNDPFDIVCLEQHSNFVLHSTYHFQRDHLPEPSKTHEFFFKVPENSPKTMGYAKAYVKELLDDYRKVHEEESRSTITREGL